MSKTMSSINEYDMTSVTVEQDQKILNTLLFIRLFVFTPQMWYVKDGENEVFETKLRVVDNWQKLAFLTCVKIANSKQKNVTYKSELYTP